MPPGSNLSFKGNQKVKPSAIQVFAIHQGPDESNKVDTGTNNNKQNHEDQTSQFLGPMIDGTGQKVEKVAPEVKEEMEPLDKMDFMPLPNVVALDVGLRFLYSKKII